MTGWCIRVYENLSTGQYSRIQSRMGLIIILAVSIIIYWLRFKRIKYWKTVLYFLLWIPVFYLPGWLSEPRLTMGLTHRYMVFAGIGLIGLMAYALDKIKTAWINTLVIGILLLINIINSQYYLREWEVFRSRSLIQKIWYQISSQISNPEPNLIFVITGPHQVISDTLNYSGSIAYLVDKKIPDISRAPLLFDNPAGAIPYICRNTYRLDNLYSWNIDKNGNLTDITFQTRELIGNRIYRGDCQVNGTVKNKTL
jgi:hypothetical protein